MTIDETLHAKRMELIEGWKKQIERETNDASRRWMERQIENIEDADRVNEFAGSIHSDALKLAVLKALEVWLYETQKEYDEMKRMHTN